MGGREDELEAVSIVVVSSEEKLISFFFFFFFFFFPQLSNYPLPPLPYIHTLVSHLD
jgi:hypothetical protein